jgi:methionyl-tRNA formyltransferase
MHPLPKFAYFGTPEVASETLAMLLERGFIPSLVVTSPDAPKGRGLVLTPSPTKSLALSHKLPVMTPAMLDASVLDEIRSYGCECAVVVAYGKIFPETFIEAFPLGIINVHYSLLPKYRGATPLETALLSGETETGVTIQKMVRELDAGDIIAQARAPIAPDETAKELRPRLIRMGAELLVASLPKYLSGETDLVAQDASLSTRAYKIKKEDGFLDLSAPSEENWRKYRAYADSIGTYFMENGKRMKITAASLQNGRFVVERVIPEGKKEIAYSDSMRK